MLTNEDIVKLSSVLATKEDIKEVKAEIAEVRESLRQLTGRMDQKSRS